VVIQNLKKAFVEQIIERGGKVVNKVQEAIVKGVVGAAGVVNSISGGDASQLSQMQSEKQHIDRQKTQEVQRQQKALNNDSKSKVKGK